MGHRQGGIDALTTLMTVVQATQAAEAEGLTLVRSSTAKSGYAGVHPNQNSSASRAFHAQVDLTFGGGDLKRLTKFIGSYSTAHEAALT